MSSTEATGGRLTALERELEAARSELAAARAEGPLLRTLLKDIAERQELERRLAEREAELALNEARFRALADATAPITWRTDAQGAILADCPDWSAFTGQSPQAYKGWGWLDAVHPDDRPDAADHWARAVDTRTPYACEYRLRRADGAYRLTLARGMPVYDPDGRVCEWVGANLDITDQRRGAEELRDQQERLRAALEGSGAGTFRWDIRTNALDWDVELDRLFGQPPGVTTRSLSQFVAQVHPDDRDEVIARCERCAAESADFEMTFRVVWPDGTLRWIYDRGATYRDADGQPLYMTGACIDVTERQEQLAQLRASEERLRLAQEAGGVGTFEWFPERDLLLASDQYYRLWGLEPGAPIDTNTLVELVLPDDRGHTGAMRTSDLTSALAYSEYRIRRADTGEIRWLAREGKLVEGEGGAPRLIGVAYDVTERCEAERHRELLIHELNHRVKNTLAVVQATAHQTLRRQDVPAEVRETFAGRLAALSGAHDILTRRSWETAYLDELLETALAPFVQQVGERIALSGPRVRLPAKTAVSFALAIHELATNAVKYGALSNDTGQVTVTWWLSAPDDHGRLNLRWEEAGGPPVDSPQRRGFGSRMIETALAAELGAPAVLQFAETGVVCAIEAPLVYLDAMLGRAGQPLPPPR